MTGALQLNDLNQRAESRALLQAGTVGGTKTHARQQGVRKTLCGVDITESSSTIFEWNHIRVDLVCRKCQKLAQVYHSRFEV
jgi:hypothetical protein